MSDAVDGRHTEGLLHELDARGKRPAALNRSTNRDGLVNGRAGHMDAELDAAGPLRRIEQLSELSSGVDDLVYGGVEGRGHADARAGAVVDDDTAGVELLDDLNAALVRNAEDDDAAALLWVAL